MEMEKVWEIFNQAYEGNIENHNLKTLYIAKEYAEKLNAHFPLTECQTRLFEKVACLVLSEENDLEEMKRFFPLLIPIEQLETALQLNETIQQELKSIKMNTVEQQIAECFNQDHIPELLLEYIRKKQKSIDSLIYIIGLSYLANEDSTKFKPHRKTIFSLYRIFFSSTKVILPKHYFLIKDEELMHKTKIILEEVNKNELLNLAFNIASRTSPSNLKQFVETIEKLYERLRLLFIQLSNLVEGKVEAHA